MSKDDTSFNLGCLIVVLVGFFTAPGIAQCGGGGGSSSSSSDTLSPSPSGGSSSSYAPSTRIDSHESYIRASDAERRRWAEEKERELKRKGINNTSAKDLKEPMDAFYPR